MSEKAITVVVPSRLCQSAQDLVQMFAEAMAQRLYEAEQKHGYEDGGWIGYADKIREELHTRVNNNGNPVDIANYAAFLWDMMEPVVKQKD